MSSFRSRMLGALALATASMIGLSAQATTFHPAPVSVLAPLTITPVGFIDSLYSDDFNFEPGNAGDATVLNYIDGYFSGGLVQIGTSAQENCGGGFTTCTDSPKGGTYAGLAANVFAIHVGGPGGTGRIFLAFQYVSAITSFTISGFENGVSFIRAYCSLDSCTGPTPGPGEVPIPGAAFLMGSILAGSVGAAVLRRRRRSQFAA